jgi:hypothetical protein
MAMHDDLSRYERWREAEAGGRDEDADRALRRVFQTLTVDEANVSPDFAAKTLAAVARAVEHDARRARRTRVGAAAATVVGVAAGAYFGTGWAISLVTSLFVGALNLLVAAIVRGATGLEAGAGSWGLLASLGRAAAAFVADPKVTFAMLAVQAVAMAALLALQRLLGSDVESFE